MTKTVSAKSKEVMWHPLAGKPHPVDQEENHIKFGKKKKPRYRYIAKQEAKKEESKKSQKEGGKTKMQDKNAVKTYEVQAAKKVPFTMLVKASSVSEAREKALAGKVEKSTPGKNARWDSPSMWKISRKNAKQ